MPISHLLTHFIHRRSRFDFISSSEAGRNHSLWRRKMELNLAVLAALAFVLLVFWSDCGNGKRVSYTLPDISTGPQETSEVDVEEYESMKYEGGKEMKKMQIGSFENCILTCFAHTKCWGVNFEYPTQLGHGDAWKKMKKLLFTKEPNCIQLEKKNGKKSGPKSNRKYKHGYIINRN